MTTSPVLTRDDVLLRAAPASSGRTRQWLRQNERPLLGAATFALLLLVWELSVRLGLARALFVSSPSLLLNSLSQAIQRGTLWKDVGVSLEEYVLGFVSAAVLGIVAGIAVGWYRRLNHLASPWLAAWYAVPHIALVPLIILWFGIGLPYKVFYVFMVSFFNVVMNTVVGVQSSEAQYLQVARSFRASQLMIFRSVVLPGALPYILTGLRQATGRAWVGVVVAELVGGNAGIGYMINVAGQMLDTSRMMLGVVLLGLFGVVLGEVMRRVERRFEVWRPQRADG